MVETRLRRIALLAIAIGCAAGVARAGEEFHETRPAKAEGHVEITNIAGSIAVEGWDRKEIEVTGILGEAVERVEFEVRGKRAQIRVILPEKSRGDGSADLRIKVPAASSLEIEAVSADIEIDGVEGDLEAASVSGSIGIAGTSGEVEVASVSGAIEVKGDVKEIEAGTVSGEIIVKSGAPAEAEFETVSGRIEFEGALREDGSYEFESFSGTIELDLEGEVNAEVELSTFSGKISHPWSDSGKDQSFTVGDGGARLSATTFSGSIEIEN